MWSRPQDYNHQSKRRYTKKGRYNTQNYTVPNYTNYNQILIILPSGNKHNIPEPVLCKNTFKSSK